MLKYIGEAYRDSARIAFALPWLFALPVTTELIQHIIEYRIGLFASFEAMEAVGGDAARMGFGQVKILSLVLLIYWVSRWQVLRGRDDRSILGDRHSATLFAGVVVLGLVLGLIQQFGGGVLAPFLDAGVLMTIGFAFFFLSLALDVYLSAWKVGSALGNARLTIAASFRIIHGNFWWSLGFSVTMMLPLMILHYALNALAVGQSFALTWAILILDALVVGCLGLVLATATFLVARRAAERASTRLAPEAVAVA